MHNREDRDSYIRINYENIQPGYLNLYSKVNKGQYNSCNTPYDFFSIMHYTIYGLAINQSVPTIYTINPQFQNGLGLGYNNGPTVGDFIRINRMYQCKNVRYI
jgi:hypothetical protein